VDLPAIDPAHKLETKNSFCFRGYGSFKFFNEETPGRNLHLNEFFWKRYAQRITNQFDYKSSRQPVNGNFYFLFLQFFKR